MEWYKSGVSEKGPNAQSRRKLLGQRKYWKAPEELLDCELDPSHVQKQDVFKAGRIIKHSHCAELGPSTDKVNAKPAPWIEETMKKRAKQPVKKAPNLCFSSDLLYFRGSKHNPFCKESNVTASNADNQNLQAFQQQPSQKKKLGEHSTEATHSNPTTKAYTTTN